MNSWPSVFLPQLESDLDFAPLSLMDSKLLKLKQIDKKSVYRMYVCGITPYDATHLGHAATYLTFDLINRYLRASGSIVDYVQNITDIDDPLLERAQRDNVDWQILAHSQIDLFRNDMINLRVLAPKHYIGAVEAIDLVSQSIDLLKEQGSIYSIENDLYFKNASSSEFGSLSHLSQTEMEEIFSQRGGNPRLPGKIDPLDCLVWMSQRAGEPGWPSHYGVGRPGWHIECTAIALKYLQPDPFEEFCIDIQGGGSDLIFPHHEMCASQARVITGKELASSYVHSAMIGLDGEKMSKSKGNLVFVSTLVNNGADPMAIRIALMSKHYRVDRMWTDELLTDAQSLLENLRKAFSAKSCADTTQISSQIISAISNDLDTPLALQLLSKWADETNSGMTGSTSGSLKVVVDALLGIAI